MANPRKFSEKIALHNQKQAEETAAFEQIMREVMGATRTSHGQDNMQTYATSYDSSYIQQAANGAYPKHQLSISPSLGAYRGGSLPNVNQMSGGPAHSIDLQGALSHLEDMRHGREAGAAPPSGAAMLPDRPHVRERGRHATAPHKGGRQMAFDKRADVSPYNSSLYLSPPPDTSWRRTNSDSALHQSAQAPQESFPGAGPSCGQRRDPVTARELDQMYRDCSARVDGFGQEILGLPDMNSMAMDNMNLKGYWDPKGGGGGDCYGNSLSNMGCGISSHQQQQHRPKSCDVPGINIYLPQDESGDGSLAAAGSPNPSLPPQQGMGGHPNNALQAPPMGNGNTGSLPDLTSLHFPPPLATPLDPSEELAQQQHQQGGGPPPLPPLHPGNAGSPGSPRGCASPSGGRHASPGPAPSPSSRRRAHHNSTSMVLGQGGRLHGGPAPGTQQPPQQQPPAVGAPGQVRAHSPLHQPPPPPQQRRHRPHPPRITVEGLTMDTNALSLDGYGGGSQQQQQQQQQQQHQHQQQQQQHQHQQQQQQLGYYPPQSPQVLGQNPGSPLGYPPPSPTLPQTPTSPRPRQLYQGGAAPSDRSGGSAPASPVSHGASSPVSSPGAVGSPYGAGGYRAGSAMGSTSPLQQQMEQFRVATSTDDSTSPSAAATHNQYFVMPDGRYCSNPNIPTSGSSGSVFFSDMGPGSGGMSAEALSCSLPYSHDSLYYTGELQYSAKTAASPSSGGAPQTPQTPTSIPDIILTGAEQRGQPCSSQQWWWHRRDAGPGTDEAALLKGALQQAKMDGGHSLGSFDSADLFSAEEALRAGLDPIDIDGLQILTDPDMAVISDPAAEEAFRLDRS